MDGGGEIGDGGGADFSLGPTVSSPQPIRSLGFPRHVVTHHPATVASRYYRLRGKQIERERERASVSVWRLRRGREMGI